MAGIKEAGVSAVRQAFAEYFTDACYRDQVNVITRYDRERAYLIGERLMSIFISEAMKQFTDTTEVMDEEDGSVTVAYAPLTLAGNGTSKPEAISDLLAQVRLYAEVYFDDVGLYLRDPVKRSHLPLLVGVQTCGSDEELAHFLGVDT